MKRAIYFALLTAATFFCLSLEAAFPRKQVFNGGADIGRDLTVTNPAVAPTAAQFSTILGTCSSARQPYRFYITERNQSGETTISPASSDYNPSNTTNRVTVTRPALNSLTTHWRAWFSDNSDAHATKRSCDTSGLGLDYSAATASMTCVCTTTANAQQAPSSNTTGTLYGTTYSSGVPIRPDLRVKEVCGRGCEFRTIAGALEAITDASATKRYTIVIYPGNYDEGITAKSYVTLRGTDRNTVRLRGPLVTLSTTLQVPADVTHFTISNLTLGGRIPIGVGVANTVRVSLFVDNCIIGITDGTDNGLTGKSIDGLFDSGTKRDWIITNSLFRSTFDAVRCGPDSTYLGIGNSFEITDDVSSNLMTIWRPAGPGCQMTEIGFRVNILSANTTDRISAISAESTTGTPTQGNLFRLIGGDINITTTNASRNAATGCYYLVSAETNSSPSTVEVVGTTCTVTVADSSSAVFGLKIDSDADHSNWSARILGGRITMSGGTSRNDVDNADTGLTPSLMGVLHAGTYTGAGSRIVDSPLTSSVHRFPTLATAPGTCSIGDYYIDTSGAYCTCSAANTWTNTNGVGACV